MAIPINKKIVLTFVCAVVFFTLPAYADAATIARPSANNIGLIGYWPLDGNTINWATASSTRDVSGSDNHGTPISLSTTTSPAPGKIGQAIKFDADVGYVNVGTASAYNFSTTSTFTLSAWVYVVSSTASLDDGVLAKSNALDSLTGYGFRVTTTGTLSAFVGGNSLSLGAITAVQGKWHHVVLVYNGATIEGRGYLDGVLKGTLTPVNFAASAAGLEIGRGGLAGRVFNGSVDDVRIYNRALSPSEVQALYGAGSTNTAHSNTQLSKGLVGYWPLDGSTINWAIASSVKDVSGSANNGSFLNLSTTTSPIQGKLGQGISFDTPATNAMRLSADPFGVAERTICTWLYPKATVNVSTIFHNGQATLFRGSTSGIHFSSDNGVTTASSGNNTAPLNKWTHVCARRSTGGTTNFYINGLPSGTADQSSGTPAAPTTGSYVGNSAGFNVPFRGYLDDVRIYNRALSDSEVKQLYALGTANVAHTESGSNAPLSRSLVGYWPLDGNTTDWALGSTSDISGSNLGGKLVNLSTTTSPVPGRVGQALYFGGSNLVSGSSIESQVNLDSSISFWMKETRKAANARPVTTSSGAGNVYDFLLLTNNSNLTANSITFTASADSVQVTSFNPGTAWQHIVGTRDSTTGVVSLYINGVLRGSTAGTPGAIATLTGKNLQIGGRVGANFFTGIIDDVRLYNRTLSPNEIKQLYNMSR